MLQKLIKELRNYTKPNKFHSLFEIMVTFLPFVLFWFMAHIFFSISNTISFIFCLLAGVFLTRLFLIQHDCGHGSFFNSRLANDLVGKILGVFTLTPYYAWRYSHSIHHATSGNLDKRGVGDVRTLTVNEYSNLSMLYRTFYRIYRNPIVMFGIGPAYLFLLRNRLPTGFSNGDRKFWLSTIGTNITIVMGVVLMIYFIGLREFILIHTPIILFAALIGVWLFYIQHQFEDSFWVKSDLWNFYDGALLGSSYYDLPGPLRWITANIGIHHVHHLNSKIPFYYLPIVLKDYPHLKNVRRITISSSLLSIKCSLWDEKQKKMVSFSEVKKPS